MKNIFQEIDKKRMEAWIWLRLSIDGYDLPQDSFGDRKKMLKVVTVENIEGVVASRFGKDIVPDESLSWIGDSKRQVDWIVDYIKEKLGLFISDLPIWLLGRSLAIANIDVIQIELKRKKELIERMRVEWEQVVDNNEIFDWFKEQEVSKCEVAWAWLRKHRLVLVYYEVPFRSYSDVLIFFDKSKLNISEIESNIRAIKKTWNQKKNRDEKKKLGIKQHNFELSRKAIFNLNKLEEKYGISRPKIIELLLQYEMEKNMYLPEKIKRMSLE